MAGVDQKLMDFVVKLTVDEAFRSTFENPASREEMMSDFGLAEPARQAIRTHDANALERLLNIQIIIPEKPRPITAGKAKKAKAAKQKVEKGKRPGRGR